MDRRKFTQLMAMTGALPPLNAFKEENMPTVKPVKLKMGDTIGLIAPASPIPKDKFDIALKNMETLGLRAIYSEQVFAEYGYLAGKDQDRLSDFRRYLNDPEVKAIWALRGGYGCTRLLPFIDMEEVFCNPKVIIGYSDLTAWLNAFHQYAGLVSFHGPVAISRPFTDYTLAMVQKTLFENTKDLVIPYNEQTIPGKNYHSEKYVINPGKVRGNLTGGNLSLLAAMCGTHWQPDFKDKIVILEDIGEKPYRIDRMIVQLLQATNLHQAAGIILGVFNDCVPEKGDKSLTLKETLMMNLKLLKMPVMYGFSFGHVNDMCTLPIGILAEMDTGKFQIRLLEDALV
jgi:muramoyltetrapeptide carboxypeptidase